MNLLNTVTWFSKKNVAKRAQDIRTKENQARKDKLAKENQAENDKYEIPKSVIFIGDIWINTPETKWIKNTAKNAQKIKITNVSKDHNDVMYDGVFSEDSDTLFAGTEVEDSANYIRSEYMLFSSKVRDEWRNYLYREDMRNEYGRRSKMDIEGVCKKPPLEQWNPTTYKENEND